MTQFEQVATARRRANLDRGSRGTPAPGMTSLETWNLECRHAAATSKSLITEVSNGQNTHTPPRSNAGRTSRTSAYRVVNRHGPNGVLLACYVEPEGSVKNITVLKSSGNTACGRHCAKRNYRPAMQNAHALEVRFGVRLY
jgi:hypothetical protein